MNADRVWARKARLTDELRRRTLAFYEKRDAGTIPAHRAAPRSRWLRTRIHRCDVLLARQRAFDPSGEAKRYTMAWADDCGHLHVEEFDA